MLVTNGSVKHRTIFYTLILWILKPKGRQTKNMDMATEITLFVVHGSSTPLWHASHCITVFNLTLKGWNGSLDN